MRTLTSMELTHLNLSPADYAAGGEEMAVGAPTGVNARGGAVLYVQPGRDRWSHRSDGPLIRLEASLSLKEAARKLVDSGAEMAEVTQDGQVIGQTTLGAILEEMSVSRDPLTGLPWSDRLREWGVSRLSEGREITIIFLDLDNFGQYNKQHGHIIGDRILQNLALQISPLVDPSEGVFVRYGGDEFVIGLASGRQAAERLAADLRAVTVRVEGVDEDVTFSIGMAGGKRTNERITINCHATLDNLINIASVEAIKAKTVRETTFVKRASAILRRFIADHPELKGQLADVYYSLDEAEGTVVSLVSPSGELLGEAPLKDDTAHSLHNALVNWASRESA
jgi:diguanylate cyclase (GGDEF)-like protein